jgi:hypothetical protein
VASVVGELITLFRAGDQPTPADWLEGELAAWTDPAATPEVIAEVASALHGSVCGSRPAARVVRVALAAVSR